MKIEILKTSCQTRNEVLKKISDYAVKLKVATNANSIFKEFINREKQGTTGFENEIAIPHARIESIKEPTIIVARGKGVDWNSLDKKLTTTAIAILIPNDKKSSNVHMETLAKVASLLMKSENIKIFKEGTKFQINKLISSVPKKAKVLANKKYDIVAVTTCPTGVAHTNMAAEALETYAAQKGISIKVERQAAQGRINALTSQEIKSASLVIVAAGKEIEEKERFFGKKYYETDVAAPIKSAKKVFDNAKAQCSVLNPNRKDTAKQALSSIGGAKPMQALMNGVSYMIPFVVVGGILIALALGIGGKPTASGMAVASNSFWDGMLNFGAIGFTLMIPILGGFIGAAIGGRAAIAPAMIISFAIGNGVNGVDHNPNIQFWNWNDMQFGIAEAKLGFLGSIAAGFLVGYLVKAWRNHISIKMPKALQPVEPIIFIPLTISFVGWIFFAFFGYVPLYYVSQGLNNGITYLVNNNLFFIAALLLGAMIAFDMGGPINKIAFMLGSSFITSGKPEVMGAVAAAIAVPPLGCGLGMLLGKYIFRIKVFDDSDKGNAISAIFMSMVGITEGAIPFAVKYPKQVMIANVLGGMIGAAVASLFQITDNAAHGGPIVYLVGAIGKNGITNYGWGLFFISSIVIGSLVTAFTMIFAFKFKNAYHKIKSKKLLKQG